ncbi:37S ribosomal protein S9, mitochondrial [Spiromyces aspiralis]|uniref:37S ribosomal protein S9, mitochondrial n=1 Tax=Spiromyces aspiralis TaxID=68401 RepID=A0ACC1HS16_9FUNG|nr:37S ribosomal protein S9, mitochondrial [Spiromyces aspiralis]
MLGRLVRFQLRAVVATSRPLALSTSVRNYAAPVTDAGAKSNNNATSSVEFLTGLDIHPRLRPDTSSYFTAKPKLSDLYIGLDKMIETHGRWIKRSKAIRNWGNKGPSWLDHEGMMSKLGITMTKSEYTTLINKLNVCQSIQPSSDVDKEEIEWYLNYFRKGLSNIKIVDSLDYEEAVGDESAHIKETDNAAKDKKLNPKRGYLDDRGRYYAIGHRKSASAQAWLVPVPKSTANATPTTETTEPVVGEVMVNGKALADYFIRAYDRESALFPLELTRQLGSYRVWATVRGGGSTGQAESVALAISRALATSNRSFRDILNKAGCLERDPRSVERKKTGQPKARKKYTWVKR